VVLLDLPSSLEQLRNVLAYGFPARVYAVLLSDADHTFSTVPTRDHFKWFYAFLRQKSPFSLVQHGEELCRYKGWSKDTVNFMTQVFFELEFVTIKDGVIFLSHLTEKRDLTESKTYRKKFEQLQVEKELVYSAYQQLKEMLETIRNDSFVHKEA
jgi:single-stranded-DNA-specific exonuclease